jgi:hypothetical protein
MGLESVTGKTGARSRLARSARSRGPCMGALSPGRFFWRFSRISPCRVCGMLRGSLGDWYGITRPSSRRFP